MNRVIQIGAGLAVSIACILYILSRVDTSALLQTLGTLQWSFLGVGILSLATDYALRVVRWAAMLRATGATVTTRECAPAFLGAMALNNVLPLRAGDVVRALVFPVSLGVSRTTATASLVLERVIDLLTLLACLGIGIALSQDVRIPAWQQHTIELLSGMGVFAILCILLLSEPISMLFQRISSQLEARSRSRSALALRQLSDLVRSLEGMSQPRRLLSFMGLSVLIWVGEAGLFFALLHGLGIDASASAALAIMALSTLATLVPSSPGYVGPFHLAAFSAVVMLGGTVGQAAGFALLAHLALWVPVTLAGMVGIVAKPSLFRRQRGVAASNE